MGRTTLRSVASLVATLVVAVATCAVAEEKTIVFVAGSPSHGYGGHEHYAGCELLAKSLREALPSVTTAVYRHEWPQDLSDLKHVASIVLFANGGSANPILQHLDEVEQLMDRGVGLACLHYAVQVPEGGPGKRYLDWIGGYYELHWSVNPHWKAAFSSFPDHPIARGLTPFEIDDEWYYHMRFVPQMKNVTPILSAIPPAETRNGPDGPHSGNPTVRARQGMAEHIGWAYQRDNGGRGFGFTGGHWHWNWAHDNFRQVVLNGIAWTAGIEIPSDGIPSKTPAWKELEEHQDYPQPENFDAQKWIRQIEAWRAP